MFTGCNLVQVEITALEDTTLLGVPTGTPVGGTPVGRRAA